MMNNVNVNAKDGFILMDCTFVPFNVIITNMFVLRHRRHIVDCKQDVYYIVNDEQ